MPYSYNPVLVGLSLLIAMQAGYVGLALATHISQGFAFTRRLLIAAAAFTLAIGIWSMHFIGMLAMRTPVAIDYLVLPTLLSFLVCVLVVGIAIYLASLRSSLMLFAASVLMGVGIATMHYVGMLAVHSTAHMAHDLAFVAASVLIAFVASGITLRFAFLFEQRPPLLLCAILFGFAVSAMHYIAMAGTTFHELAAMPATNHSIVSSDIIAVIVSVVACSISGIFMLALVPSEAKARQDFAVSSVGEPSGARGASHDSEPPPPTPEEKRAPVDSLPIESRGSRFDIAVPEIVAVHANAHYTYVFNGREDLFCPLSITEVAESLPKSMFYRTHRSHIVNLALVLKVSRVGDAGVAELKAPTRRVVPVSRARMAPFKAEVSRILAIAPGEI
jgi:NO-binding membrane sensor protein with MHYT domain